MAAPHTFPNPGVTLLELVFRGAGCGEHYEGDFQRQAQIARLLRALRQGGEMPGHGSKTFRATPLSSYGEQNSGRKFANFAHQPSKERSRPARARLGHQLGHALAPCTSRSQGQAHNAKLRKPRSSLREFYAKSQ